MIKKISLPVVVTIMCILVAVVIGLVFINKNGGFGKKKTVDNEIKITRTDYSGVARKTLDWIDQQRNEDGWYILERGCDYEKKTCDVVWDNDEGNKDGLIATWARFNFYQQTKDPKDLENVKSDINKFYEKYPNGVDNALWICKITYDMWKSDLFDQSIKDKLEKICFESKFPTPEEVTDYLNTGKDEESKRIAKELTPEWSSWDGYRVVFRGFDSVVGLPSDFISKYLWKKDKKYLDLVSDYLSVQNEFFEQKTKNYDFISAPEDICLLGLSNIDAYVSGNISKDGLNKAMNIYNKFMDVPENKIIFQTTVCGLFQKKLFTTTNQQIYLKILEANSKKMAESGSDSNLNKILDDSSLFKYDGRNNGSFYKNIVENSLAVELLRN